MIYPYECCVNMSLSH